MSDHLAIAVVAAVASIFSAGLTAWGQRDARAIRTALTKNGGKNNPPTMPDWFHKLDKGQDLLIQKVDQHLADAAAETIRRDQTERDLWSAINTLRK